VTVTRAQATRSPGCRSRFPAARPAARRARACRCPSPKLRAVSSATGSTDRTPYSVFTNIGQNAAYTIITIRISAPSRRTGSRAESLRPTAPGATDRPTSRARRRRAGSCPSAARRRSPARRDRECDGPGPSVVASCNVSEPSASSRTSAPATADGAGMSDGSTPVRDSTRSRRAARRRTRAAAPSARRRRSSRDRRSHRGRSDELDRGEGRGGSATPRPAMSNALPCRRSRTASRAIESATLPRGASSFTGTCPGRDTSRRRRRDRAGRAACPHRPARRRRSRPRADAARRVR